MTGRDYPFSVQNAMERCKHPTSRNEVAGADLNPPIAKISHYSNNPADWYTVPVNCRTCRFSAHDRETVASRPASLRDSASIR